MTVTVQLTSTPIRVSNGSKAVHVTIKKGSKPFYAISATMPNKSAYHVLEESVMNIGEGFSVWMWNGNSYPIEITYTEAQ